MTDRLLLVIPLRAFQHGTDVFVDAQARNGLKLWLDNFDVLTLACPTSNGSPPAGCLPIDDSRITFLALPVAYTPHRFASAVVRMWRPLADAIDQANYLHFGIGGVFGDWGSLGALIAHGKRRPYAVWTDRVESQVVSFQAGSKTGLRKLYGIAHAALIKHYERQIIRRSALGLFHGMDCYTAYSTFSSNPHLVHDVHLGKANRVVHAEIEERLRHEGPIRIAYAGRVHRDKGIFDWIEALTLAADLGVVFTATWFGEGPELERARKLVATAGLEDRIHLPGATDHAKVIRLLRSFDLLMFCHKTMESPRCLVEALICGLPLVGYDAPYPRDLIKNNGGGLLVKPDPKALATALATVPEQRDKLTRSAFQDGLPFDDERVFHHRSELIKMLKRS
jgi:colanic acid/amylovoran biosynthesis glycosyltransferase